MGKRLELHLAGSPLLQLLHVFQGQHSTAASVVAILYAE